VTIRRLDAIYGTFGIAFGLLMPFQVPLLVARGLGPAEIGLVLGVAGVASLMAYLVWGAIADGWLGRRRTIALTSLTAGLGGLMILAAGEDPLALTVAISVAVVGALASGPLIDALILGELGESSATYGRVRVWASVGWAASAIVGGAVWMQVGPEPVYAAFVVAALLLAAIVLWPSGRTVARARSALTSRKARRPSIRAWLPWFVTPVMLGFLLGLLVNSVGEHASWRYVSLRILDQGGGVMLVGLAAALPAIVEIPVFANSRPLTSRWGLRGLFVVGAVAGAALMALVAIAAEAWMVTTLRTIEGAAYALRYMGMVLIVGALLPRHLYALGQSVAWFVYAGVAPIVADVAGGVIYDVFGAQVLFAGAAAALLGGGLIVYAALSGPTFARRERRAHDARAPVPPPPA
jgi:PPP family 3-phenylpropionic acid transporter